MRWSTLIVMSGLVSSLLACGEDEAGPCRVAADCASGVCLPDGRCALFPDADDVLIPETDVQIDDTADGEDAAAETISDTDVAPDADSAVPDASETSDTDTITACLPNRDGRITRAEVPIAPDLQATYLVASGVAFDSRGTPDGDPRWDLAQSFAGDTKVLVTTLDPANTWYGPSFPTATYATKLADDGDLLGVFEAKDDGLYLLGVVSPTGGAARTELAYDPPARLVAYPLEVGTTWTSTSSISGLTSGVATFASETYEGHVDARGKLATPFADFDALRIVLTLDRWVGFALIHYDVSHLFVTECFGTVATLRSQAYVSGPEMTTAGELRRLSP